MGSGHRLINPYVRKKDASIPIEVRFLKRDGNVEAELKDTLKMEQRFDFYWYDQGWGSETPGTWKAGDYVALAYVDGDYVGGAPSQLYGAPVKSAWDIAGQVYLPRMTAQPQLRGGQVPWDQLVLPITATHTAGDWVWAGRAWIRRSDLVACYEAEAYYTDYLKSHPQDARAYYLRSINREYDLQGDEALSDINRVIELQPGVAEYYVARANLRPAVAPSDGQSAGSAPASLAVERVVDLQRARELAPTSARPAFEAARGFLDDLLPFYDEFMLDDVSWYPEPQFLRGLADSPHDLLDRLNQTPERLASHLENFDEAIRLDPKFAPAYVGRAYVRLVRNDLTGTVSDITRVLELDPQCNYFAPHSYFSAGLVRADLLNLRAMCWTWLGQHQPAREQYELAIREALDPASSTTDDFLWMWRRELAWLLATSSDPKVRDPSRSLSYAKFAHAAAEKKSSRELDVLAAAFAAAGDFEAAVAWQTNAVQCSDWEDHSEGEHQALVDRLELYRKERAYFLPTR